ncbi:MAG: divalent-cation tolerance protein CutA [Dehalococcoidales bacterium]|nr:divalent-cation tolerance protein CutA [Dehalococcoidales bacterium]
MANSKYIVIFITTEAGEEAKLIARVLLEQRKAACINIVNGVSSLFWWQEKIDSARESMLIVKTRASLLDDVIQIVKEIHSNDVPEIIAFPIIGGNEDYLEWIGKEVF